VELDKRLRHSSLSAIPASAHATHVAHPTQTELAQTKKRTNVLPSSVQILPRSPALTEIHTQLRDVTIEQDAFQFTLHRLGRLLVACGIDHFYNQTLRSGAGSVQIVTTPTNSTFVGPPEIDLKSICAVSIVRGGETMEICVRDGLPDCAIGKIVIAQTWQREEGARLYYCKLPSDISSRRVMLLDPTLSTGNAIIMALRVLIDHSVKQENIVVLCIAASHHGLRCVSKAFPHVKIITSWLDAGLDENYYLMPGA